MTWIYQNFIRVLVILGPTWITAYLTDKMVYVIPMLAACTVIATSLFPDSAFKRRLDEDGYKKDNSLDIGSRKDDG